MKRYAKIQDKIVIQIDCNPIKGFEDVDSSVICGMIQNDDKSFSMPIIIKTADQLKEEYKEYYIEVFNDKLKELDYDSIATIELWISDDTFGIEAQKIKDWYKSLINTNYRIIKDIEDGKIDIPAKIEYLDLLPKYDNG